MAISIWEKLVRKNTYSYWWPEAESNCRPLVFQIEANHLTFLHFTLFIINLRSFTRGSKTQRAVNNEDFFCECVGVLSEFNLVYLWRPIEPMFIVARGRIELPTPCFSDKCSTDWAIWPYGGDDGIRTRDLLRDRQAWTPDFTTPPSSLIVLTFWICIHNCL